MKREVLAAVLGTLFAMTGPAFADHTRAMPTGSATESSLDIDLKLGPRSFRLGGRLFGREGYAGGAWLNGEARPDGFSLDGRIERGGKAHDFKFDANIDEWARRVIRWPGVTDL